MRRDIERDLLSWKNEVNRLPLLLRGARQVGKTYVVEDFAKRHFENTTTVNFELSPELKSCFDHLDPKEILPQLELLTHQKITPGRTLLFLDEIQDCPNAIRALRYFKEKLPELHVIGAGSLLEFTLNDADFRMPVGRVQSIYLHPLSFKEYLVARDRQDLRDWIENFLLSDSIPEPIHQLFLKYLREYFVLGGMPAVLQKYREQENVLDCQHIQTALLSAYRHDFGKYAKLTDHKYLQRLFEKIPAFIGEHIRYSKVDPDMRARDLRKALDMLKYAGLVYPIYGTPAITVPLVSMDNEKRFKVIFLDIGLLMRSGKLEAEFLMNQDIVLANRGNLAEQFVGQELLANRSHFEEDPLYFWYRDRPSSTAEVDYVIAVLAKIIPIEVKAGATGQLKSLKIFMQDKKSPLGIRLSQRPFENTQGIISLPLYLAGEIERLMRD